MRKDGGEDYSVPWSMIHENPSDYYDSDTFAIRFPKSTVDLWTRNETMTVAEFMIKTSSISSTSPFMFYNHSVIHRRVPEQTPSTSAPDTTEAPRQSPSSQISAAANPVSPSSFGSISMPEAPATAVPSSKTVPPPQPDPPATQTDPATPAVPVDLDAGASTGSTTATVSLDVPVAASSSANSGHATDGDGYVSGSSSSVRGGQGSPGDKTVDATVDVTKTTSTSTEVKTKGRRRKVSQVLNDEGWVLLPSLWFRVPLTRWL